MGFCIIHARTNGRAFWFSRMKFDQRFARKRYLLYSWNLNLYMFKQVWNCSRESFVMMFSRNEKSGSSVWKIIFLCRQSNEKKILLRYYYYYIVCANFRLRDGVSCNRKETSREKSLLWFAKSRWLFAIYLEVDSNAININEPDKLRWIYCALAEEGTNFVI